MLLQCTNCGAPLDARAAKNSIKCNYCGAVQITESLAVQHREVPIGWKPPEVWVAPAQFAAAGQNLAYRKTMAGIQAVIMLAVFAPVVLGALGAGGAAIASSVRRSNSPTSTFASTASWSGSSTYKCDGVATPTIAGPSTQKLTAGVEVAGNCHLVINGGTIRVTDIGVHVWDNGKLELHGTKLIVNGARTSTPVAIRGTGNAEIDLYDCTVEIDHGGGDALAVEADGNSKVRFHGGAVTGRYTLKARDAALINSLFADVRGRIDSAGNASILGVRGVNEGAGDAHGAGDCSCAAHDHACRKRCRKGR